jgi:hypothetical protein
MSARRRKISRREFIGGMAGVTLAGPLGVLAGACEPRGSEPPTSSDKKSRVVLVRDEAVLDEHGRLDGVVLQRMFEEAIAALVGKPDHLAAWKDLIRPSDTVGIKSNVWSFLRTPPALEQTIKRHLIDAGIAAERIGIDDRGVLGNQLFRQSTALINVRPMRTHHWAGVGSLIKNYIMFSPTPPDWHGDSCANLAGLWELPIVKDKTRLNVLVMLTPLFQSKGPHDFSRKYTWPYKGLLVGTDPVATDATGLRILQAKRLGYFGEERPFEVPPKHIKVAEQKFGLGVADPSRIEVVKLGWPDGVLI